MVSVCRVEPAGRQGPGLAGRPPPLLLPLCSVPGSFSEPAPVGRAENRLGAGRRGELTRLGVGRHAELTRLGAGRRAELTRLGVGRRAELTRLGAVRRGELTGEARGDVPN